jgi:RNA polymerase sigma-70 factor (family 1)
MEDLEGLLVGVQQGDKLAFKALYESLKGNIYSYAYRFFRSSDMAEETVQNVFMQVWKHRNSIDPDKSVKAYIYRIARNSVYNQLKQAAHHENYKVHLFYRASQVHNEVEEAVSYKQLLNLYEEAINKLPPQRKLIFRMSRIDFLSHEEIAGRLDISKSTVKDQIVKALRSIKQYLFTQGEIKG